METKKIFVFTDVDLDGTASLIALHWALGKKPGELPFKSATVGSIRKEFLAWAENDSIKNYDIVYFLDLDMSNEADLIDHPNVTIIDHHQSHVNAKGVYKNAKHNITETTSCAKLIYHHFKDTVSLADAQKYFILLADDYDCYKFALAETYNLNALFNNTQRTLDKTRQHKFLDRFYNGFDKFTQIENNIISEHVTNRDKTIANLEIFEGTINVAHAPHRIVGSFGNKFVNEVCDHLIKNYRADIVFFINPNNEHVSWRKNKNCPVNLSILAEKLTNGGGHEYAAGGKLTETFIDFLKLLTPFKK